ncbi:MAG: MoaE-MoaD fusion protein [Solirubrobacterales bacterium]|jgi:molybdenum cofactor biosynthesis protein MoaC|nr:MoaE-MoaD fusion protein [Solirubrobacterales bacterium]
MASMEVELRLFAIFRERAGRDRLVLELPEGATVADALEAAAREPGLGELLPKMPARVAVNREYVGEEAVIADGDELALIPPVSGGATAPATVRVTDEPLSIINLANSVGRPGAGAVVVFCGVTRDVERLEYEAYGEMAEQRIAAILEAVTAEHGLEAAAAEHRVGSVPLGEPSVVVAVSAAHREEAFAGARAAIDRIKAEAPIWKREVEGGEGEWVEGTPPPVGEAPKLTHLDDAGSARMVDVGDKEETQRRARAEATLRMSPETAAALARGDAPKGDVLGTARIAGIGAAKRTGELIPLAHPLALDFIDVEGTVDVEAGLVRLAATAGITARTGVEMEAMTACAVAALTVYDMVKGLERGVSIEAIELVEKSGGRSGEWRRDS